MAKPVCSICSHADRAGIDGALESGESTRAVASRFGVSQSGVSRHKAHLGRTTEPVSKPAPRESTRRTSSKPKPAHARARVADAAPPKRHRNHAAEVERTLLEAEAVKLRLAGKSFAEIAAALGSTSGTCCDAVERVLMRTRDYTNGSAEVARAVEVARCDALIAAIWARATDESGDYDGQDKALTGAVKIMERRAKLLGLDERVKVDVTSAGQALGLPAGHPLASLGRAPTVEELEAFAARGVLPQSEKSN